MFPRRKGGSLQRTGSSNTGVCVWDPQGVHQEELERVQKRAARFVTENFNYETGSMTRKLGQTKGEFPNGSILLNIHEVWPRPFWGGSSHQNKLPVDHFIGHIPFASLEGDKRPDKINQK